MNRASVPARSRVRFAIAISVAFGTVAGCSTTSPTPTHAPSTTARATDKATDLPPASFGAPASPTPPDDATPLVVDAGLLAFLPALVDSIPVREDADAAAEALGNEALPGFALAVDAAVAVDVANGNLVYALVVRLRPNAFGDEAYRQWRDSYDQGACAAAGGVIGNAEATIADRQVFITSCVQGMHTYHTWLKAQGIVISASAIGEGRFGEKLLTNLRVAS